MLKTHRIFRGASADLKFPLLYSGVAQPIEGWKFWFTAKLLPNDADAAALLAKTTDNGGIVAHDATNARVLIEPADTKTKAIGRYYYDIEAQSPSGRREPLEHGYLYIDPEMTSA
ncbi:MAG: hypothetical protein AAB368_16725 [bacterium]